MKTYYYTGDFEHLQKLGFLQDVFKAYWFLPSRKLGFNHCLFIDSNTKQIEYSHEEDLIILKDLYLEVSC